MGSALKSASRNRPRGHHHKLGRGPGHPGCAGAAHMRVPVTCLGIGLASAGPTRGAGLPHGAPAKLRVIAHPHGRPRPRRRSCRVSHH
jgi:hypothetical protein